MTPTDPLDSEIRRLVVSVADRAPSPPRASDLRRDVSRRPNRLVVGAAVVAAIAAVALGVLALRHDDAIRIRVIAPPETDGAAPSTPVATPTTPPDSIPGSVTPGVTDSSSVPASDTTGTSLPVAPAASQPTLTTDERLAAAARGGQMVLIEGLPPGASIRGWNTFPLDEVGVPRRVLVKEGDSNALVGITEQRATECGGPSVDAEPIAGRRTQTCPIINGQSSIVVDVVTGKQQRAFSGRGVALDELRAVATADIAGSIADGWRGIEALNGAGGRANQHRTWVNILRAEGDLIVPIDGVEASVGLSVDIRTGVPDEAAWVDMMFPNRPVDVRGRPGRAAETDGLAAVRWIETEGLVVEVSGHTVDEVVELAAGLRFVTPTDAVGWAVTPQMLLDPTVIEPPLALAGLSPNAADGSVVQLGYDGGESGRVLRAMLATQAGELASLGPDAVLQGHRDVGCADVTVNGQAARLLVDAWGSPAVAWQYAPGLVVGLSTGTRQVRPGVILTPADLVRLAETVHIASDDEWVAAISDLSPGVPLGEPKDYEFRDVEDGPTTCPWP